MPDFENILLWNVRLQIEFQAQLLYMHSFETLFYLSNPWEAKWRHFWSCWQHFPKTRPLSPHLWPLPFDDEAELQSKHTIELWTVQVHRRCSNQLRCRALCPIWLLLKRRDFQKSLICKGKFQYKKQNLTLKGWHFV